MNPTDPNSIPGRVPFGGYGGMNTGQGMNPGNTGGSNPYMAQSGPVEDTTNWNQPQSFSAFPGQGQGGAFDSQMQPASGYDMSAFQNIANQARANYQQPQQQGGSNPFNDNQMSRPNWWGNGEAGPQGSPDFVRNPDSFGPKGSAQNQAAWEQRYNWLQQNQQTAYTPQAPINAWYQQNDPQARAQLQQLASTPGASYNGMNAQGAQRQLMSWDAEAKGGKLEPGAPGYPAGRYHMPDGQIIDVATGRPVGYDPGSQGFMAQQRAMQPAPRYSGGGGSAPRPGGGVAPAGGGIPNTAANMARAQHLASLYGGAQGKSLFEAEQAAAARGVASNGATAVTPWLVGSNNLPPTTGPSYQEMIQQGLIQPPPVSNRQSGDNWQNDPYFSNPGFDPVQTAQEAANAVSGFFRPRTAATLQR